MALDLKLPNTPQDIRLDEDNLFTHFNLIYNALKRIADNVTETDTGTGTTEEVTPPVIASNEFNGIQTYIQDGSPGVLSHKYLWVQTGLGSGADQYKFWFFDGTTIKLIVDPFTNSANAFQKGADWDCGGAVALIAGDCKEISTRLQRSGTIKKWTIIGESAAGSAEFDVWKTTFGLAPPNSSHTIVNGDYPSITAGVVAQKSNLSLWTTTTVSNGDILTFKVRSCSTFTWVCILLDIQ